MTEPIEKWREEFESWYRGIFTGPAFKGFNEGDWAVWRAAKRSQPVVELPIPEKDCFSACYECGDIHEALTDAGIQYRIKGD